MTTPAELLRLEQRLDERLPRPFLAGRPGTDLLEAARQWSDAVWASAADAGPIPLAAGALERGVEVGFRPVFVCGAHRSGTTLVRDLLDGHPALIVLPAEGTFVGGLQARLATLPRAQALSLLGREWVRRLANPINRPPYWLLGRTDAQRSPYVAFARALHAWWGALEPRVGTRIASWPLLAVALAYGASPEDGTLPPGVTRWAEKTPTNERFLDRLCSEFPAAKVVQLVRHPVDLVASRKVLEARAHHSFKNLDAVLRDLTTSYRVALEHARTGARDRYLLLRYEDLVDAPAAAVTRLAAFLEIEHLPALMRPTVAGLPALSNSSFDPGVEAGRIHTARSARDVLSQRERDHVAAAVGPLARTLGYDVPDVGRWRAGALRLARLIRLPRGHSR